MAYPATLHYDPTVTRTWVGSGKDELHAICGQSEQIVVTGDLTRVECEKCLRIVEKKDRS